MERKFQGIDNLACDVDKEACIPAHLHTNLGPDEQVRVIRFMPLKNETPDNDAKLWKSSQMKAYNSIDMISSSKSASVSEDLISGISHPLVRPSASSPPLVRAPNNAGANNNNNIIDTKVVDFDDVLPHVGEFGTYQIILFFLTAPFCFFLAFSYFGQVFITLTPDHWCHIPELNNSGLTPQEM